MGDRLFDYDQDKWVKETGNASGMGSVIVYGQIDNSGSIVTPRIDSSTDTLQTINYAHHEIHAGSHFFLANGTGLGSAQEAVLQLDTCATDEEPHMLFTFVSGLGAEFELYEGTDMSGTNYIPIPNSNRRSPHMSCLTASNHSTGGTTTGTLIASLSTGSTSVGGKAGGGSRSDEEIILKSGTSYLLVARSLQNSNNLSTFVTFYEHTPKN